MERTFKSRGPDSQNHAYLAFGLYSIIGEEIGEEGGEGGEKRVNKGRA